MRVKIFCILFLILLAINTLAEEGPLYIFSAGCEKDGSINMIFKSFSTNKIYTEDINIKAKKLFEKLGFKEVKVNRIIYPWNEIFGFSRTYEMICRVQVN